MSNHTMSHEENHLSKVTVAVCVYNGAETVAACLDSLMELDYPNEKLTILIVDNGSTDSTREIVAKYPVNLISEPKRGRGHARNRAWQNCETPFIAFTDADCVVSSSWLLELMPIFQNEKVGLVGGDIITPGNENLAKFFELRRIVSNQEFSGEYPQSPPFLATANAIFRLSAIREVHGFSTIFRVAEDADICWKITSLGYQLEYKTGAIVYHFHRTQIRKLFQQAIDYGHDGVHVYLEHFSLDNPWIWWGLYYRILESFCRIPWAVFKDTSFERQLPFLDFVRYSGLAIGRIIAALKFKKIVL